MKTLRPTSGEQLPDTPYRVLLADDHAVVRMGLKSIIGSIDKNIHLDEAAGGDAVIARLKSKVYDLVILDINLRRTESFSLIVYLRREFPLLKVLIYTANDEMVFGIRFMRSGVNGYLNKQSDEGEIVEAFEEVRAGRPYLSKSLCRQMYGYGRRGKPSTPFESLTDREFEVTLQILQGNSPEEIARILHLNKSTVATHKCRIMKKLEVDNQMDLLQLARRYGVVLR